VVAPHSHVDIYSEYGGNLSSKMLLIIWLYNVAIAMKNSNFCIRKYKYNLPTWSQYHILSLIMCNELSRRRKRSLLTQVVLKFLHLICKRIDSKVNTEYIFKTKSTMLECIMHDMFV
jgi:hypothetical protein